MEWYATWVMPSLRIACSVPHVMHGFIADPLPCFADFSHHVSFVSGGLSVCDGRVSFAVKYIFAKVEYLSFAEKKKAFYED